MGPQPSKAHEPTICQQPWEQHLSPDSTTNRSNLACIVYTRIKLVQNDARDHMIKNHKQTRAAMQGRTNNCVDFIVLLLLLSDSI